MIRVVKNHDKLKALSVSCDTDRAVTDFRAFEPVATLHASRVTDCNALDIMFGVVDQLHKNLTERKNVIADNAKTL